ncbi:MAG TPA: hypothetical protein VL093_12795 [Flavipsychrobacter sp.]|jgi:hypothetical protein|nr:hypothetical protein [Flavipsychrobacter sp.]
MPALERYMDVPAPAGPAPIITTGVRMVVGFIVAKDSVLVWHWRWLWHGIDGERSYVEPADN